MKGGTALPMEVMTALGFEANTFMEPWVQDWADWDDKRPWPEFSATE